MSSVLDFAAGKYGVFVWPAYGVSALMFAVFITQALWRARRWRREAERLEHALTDDKTNDAA